MFRRTLASRQTTAQRKTSKENSCATAESRTKCRLVRPTQSFGAKNAKTTLTMQNSPNTTTKRCWCFFSLIYCAFVAVIFTSCIWRARNKHKMPTKTAMYICEYILYLPRFLYIPGGDVSQNFSHPSTSSSQTFGGRNIFKMKHPERKTKRGNLSIGKEKKRGGILKKRSHFQNLRFEKPIIPLSK